MMTRYAEMRAMRSATLIVTLLMLLGTLPARAVLLNAHTSVGLAYSPSEGIVPQADDTNQSTTTGSTAAASSDLTFDYSPDGYATVLSGSTDASASETALHAVATSSATDFAPGLPGESFSVVAFASLSNDYTMDTIADLFASPIFHLDGTLSASGDLVADVSLSAHGSQLFQRSVSSADGLVTIDQDIMAPAVSPSILIGYSVSLQASVEGALADMAAGNHGGTVDFGGTAMLLGFALFEDEAMTIPFLDPVTITTGDGVNIPVITQLVPLPPAACLLGSGLLGLLGLLGISRRTTVH
jgi:hypothetical protein